MTNALVLDDPWSRITAACKKSRADVAVAYVGQGATRLLRLRAGSKLVVDASEAAVRSGQTDPRELLKYFNKGVDVFSKPRLHAKVFAFKDVAFVGSTNVSNRSANVLTEAAVALSGSAAVAQARRFVLDVATAPMGKEFLKKLVKIYRPPRVPGGGKRRKGRVPLPARARRMEGGPLRLVRLVPTEWNEAEHHADKVGRRVALKLKKRGFKLDSFGWPRWRPGGLDEEVLMMMTYGPREVFLAPPGRVLAAPKVRGSEKSIVQIELRPKNRKKLSVIRKRLPASTVKRLKRTGLLAPRHAAILRELWK